MKNNEFSLERFINGEDAISIHHPSLKVSFIEINRGERVFKYRIAFIDEGDDTSFVRTNDLNEEIVMDSKDKIYIGVFRKIGFKEITIDSFISLDQLKYYAKTNNLVVSKVYEEEF